MALRYIVPGVLALVGCWWWYTSRKKVQITSQDNEETQDMLTLPSEGSVTHGSKEIAPTVSSGEELAKAECPEPETEVAGDTLAVPFAENVQVDLVEDSPSSTKDECAQSVLRDSVGPESPMESASVPLSASTPLSDASVGPQHHVNGDFSRPAETTDINEELQHLAASLITEVISAALQEVIEKSSYEISEAASSCALDKEPTTVEPVCQNESSHLSTGDEQDFAMQPQDKNTEEQETDTKEDAPTVSSVVDLPKAECPEPEAEVTDEILAVPFAENVQVDLVKDSPSSTRDDLSSTAPKAVDECTQSVLRYSVGPESPMVSASFPLPASTPLSDASVGFQHLENGDFSQPAETSDNTEELQHLAASLITEVISAAQQEVMAVSSCAPSFNDEEPTKDEDLHTSHVGSSSQSHTDDIQEQAAQIVKEVINGCLTPHAWEKAKDKQERLVSSQGQLTSTPVLPKLQAEEIITATEDSGCSTSQSEDGISDKDLLLGPGLFSAVPESIEEPIQNADFLTAEPVCPPVTVMAHGQQDTPSCTIATTDFQQDNPGTIGRSPSVPFSTLSNLVEKCSHNRPDAAAVSTESSHLSTEDEQDFAMQPQDKNTDEQEPDMKEDALTVSLGVDLPKAECPEPEEEVADDILAVPFAENLQVDLVKDSPSSTRDDLSYTAPKAVDECAQSALGHFFGPESPVVSASFPLSASKLVSEASVGSQHLENGDFSQPAETGDNTENLQHLTASLITEVNSVGQQEVMAVSSCAPSFNDKEPTKGEDLHTSHVGSSSCHTDDIQEQAAQIVKEVINGCLTPYAQEKAEDKQECLVSSQGQLALTPVLPKPQATEAIPAAKDSGCSMSQSEDGISDKDLLDTGLFSAVPENKEEPIQNSGNDDLNEMSGISKGSEKKEDGLQEDSDFAVVEKPVLTRDHVAAVCEAALLNGPGLQNGTSKAEAGQSGGHLMHMNCSDENSMSSADSCFTLRMGGQQSCSQASPSQSSELIEWEIEVPKHLVSRLIGKQGKYMNFLKQSSGAEVYVITLPHTEEFEICHVEGTQQQVDEVLALIGKKFRSFDLTNLHVLIPLPSLPTLDQVEQDIFSKVPVNV
ncbi:uncharacterized protein [Salminus brasiliensis]|uniref:uncharacterized protein n=1 Tax=Salminus brasiliensis TaxID=930266 RepID=UPI003B839889